MIPRQSTRDRTNYPRRECPRASCDIVLQKYAAASACRERAQPSKERLAARARRELCRELDSWFREIASHYVRRDCRSQYDCDSIGIRAVIISNPSMKRG